MTTSHPVERVTDAVAVGAVSSPVWLDYIQPVSDLAAALLPIAGLIWLGVQMYSHIKRKLK